MNENLYSDFSIICPTPENNGLNNAYEYYYMVKENPEKKVETEGQLAIRKENRKEWGSIERKLIEMAPKLEDNGLIKIKTTFGLSQGFLNWPSIFINTNSF